MSRRWEGSPVGNFSEQVYKNSNFFMVFPRCTGIKILDFSAVSCDFLGYPKKMQNKDFSAVSQDFAG
jgi:hypothetical protein